MPSRARITPLVLALALGLAACTTSPLGRRQLKLFPEAQMAMMGVESFQRIQADMPRTQDASKTRYVQCVADAVTRAVEPGEGPGSWEVVVFEERSANAFALPGGKIGVHTGLLAIATNQDQLAAVLGHEVAHVLAGHANERVSQSALAESSLALVSAAAGTQNLSPAQREALGLLGVGIQYGVILPYSRTHESEADLMGLDLMAKAGFEPAQSAALWRNMSAGGGVQPPEILSTHPSHETRIRDLEKRVPSANALRDAAWQAGHRPSCR
jgi:predicted Zn-dependent protease